MRSFLIKTLGCKVNQYEEQVMRETLLEAGFREVTSGADVVIVNSCTVTGKADQKTRRIIRKLRKENPAGCVAVTGCYVVVKEDIERLKELDDIDIIVPNKDKALLPSIIGDYLGVAVGRADFDKGVSGFESHNRAFLKVQDGCDQRCSYCKVAIVRGPSRSRSAGLVADEFRRLAGAGYSEIVLTGICLGDWRGGKGEGLPQLLKKVADIPGPHRIRLSSIEPNFVDDELIDTIASSGRVCKHLHIPLQSGSDRILTAMGRRYSAADFERLVGRLRGRMPLVGITMDVIAGFPGEEEMDFSDTVHLIERIRPSRLHVFNYSDRQGTRSSKLAGKVPEAVKKDRVERLIEVGNRLQVDFCEMFKGKNVEVMIESSAGEAFSQGYTAEYLRAKIPGKSFPEGKILTGSVEAVEEADPSLILSI